MTPRFRSRQSRATFESLAAAAPLAKVAAAEATAVSGAATS